MNSTSSMDEINLSQFSNFDPKLNLTSTFPTTSVIPPSPSSPLTDFRNRCFFPDTELHVCENILQEIQFNCNFPSELALNEVLTNSEITQLTATCIACIVGLLGNLLVVIAMPSDSSSRSPISYFLINLSLADILISVVCTWDNALRSLSYNYMLGYLGCKGGGFIHMTCLFVSVFTLVGIAIDRVYAVLLPLKARFTSPSPRWTLIIVWILGLSAAAPFCALRDYKVYVWKDFTEVQCSYNRGRGIYNPENDPPCEMGENYVNTYHLMVTILLFFLPVLIMILAYVMIIIRLWRTSNFIGDSRLISKAHFNAKKRAVLLALMVLAAFLVCWTPLQASILLSIFGENQFTGPSTNRQTFWIYFLAYFNSCLNPLIYGGFSKSYRAALIKVFRRSENKKGFSILFGRSRGTGTVSFSVPRSECIPLRQRISRASVHFTSNNSTHLKKTAIAAVDCGKKESNPDFHLKEPIPLHNLLTMPTPEEDYETKLVSASEVKPPSIKRTNSECIMRSSAF